MKILVSLAFYSEFKRAKAGLAELKACKEHTFIVVPRQGVYIGKTRNSVVNGGKSTKRFQKPVDLLGFDFVLDVDSDVDFTLNHVLSMIARDKDCVNLPYKSQTNPEEYECGWFTEGIPGNIAYRAPVTKKGFHPVDYTGNGMRLTKVHVYEKMEYPWYYHPMIEWGEEREEMPEDIGFCMNVKKSGFEIWVDFDLPVGHKIRNLEDFNWEVPNMAKKEKPQRLMESLSQLSLELNRISILMVDEYGKAVSEVKDRHNIIQEQAEKIKTLESRAKELETQIQATPVNSVK